jgi:hypothetical protein
VLYASDKYSSGNVVVLLMVLSLRLRRQNRHTSGYAVCSAGVIGGLWPLHVTVLYY